MARHGEITAFWGDGEHTFRLAISEMRELQEKLDCGPFAILGRFRNHDWRVDEIREVIRIGLIGGGMLPANAHKLVKRYFDDIEVPLLEHLPVAIKALMAPIYGVPEPVGKKKPAKPKRKSRKTPGAGSTSRVSTATEASSAGA